MAFTDQNIVPIIREITNKRFFKSERGYQGQLISILCQVIKDKKIFPDNTIVEQEYQKTIKLHLLRQRPDIIIHIPLEVGLTDNRKENNYYVIALKLAGEANDAMEDFEKLDEMFNQLDYPEGVFINIGAYPVTFLSEYKGLFKDRIHELSISLNKDVVCICHARFEDEKIIETIL